MIIEEFPRARNPYACVCACVHVCAFQTASTINPLPLYLDAPLGKRVASALAPQLPGANLILCSPSGTRERERETSLPRIRSYLRVNPNVQG